MQKEVTNMGANMGTTDMGTKFEYSGSVTATTTTSQHPAIINNRPKVLHPGRLRSPRFAFERPSLFFCILWCITNFTIAHCTGPVFNYEFERLKVFGGFYMVRQTVPNFRSKDSQAFASKGNLLCTGIFKFNTYFSRTSQLVSLKLKRSLINSGLRLLIVL